MPTMNSLIEGAEGKMNQQHIVLVHGSCHGAWCWYKVATRLKSAGHRVTATDLAASGIDARKIEEVTTFVEYSQPLLTVLASLPPEEKVVLVGHSFGGLSIALAADKYPEKVAAMVFVAAFLPDCSSSPSYVIKQFKQTPQFAGMATQFSSINIGKERILTTLHFRPQFGASEVYQLSPPEDLMLATTLARPSSLFVEDLESTPALSKDGYGSVPAFYVVCSEDALLTKDFQQWMIRNNGNVNEVMEIKGADHMPMFSKPQELSQFLLHIADNLVG